MPFARTSYLRSFRFRIVAGLFVVVVGTMIATTFLVRAILNPVILADFDEQLIDECNDVISLVKELFHDQHPTHWNPEDFKRLEITLERRARSLGDLKWFIRLFDADGSLLYPKGDQFPRDELLEEIPVPQSDDDGTAHETGPYRWVAVRGRTSTGTPYFWVQSGRTLNALVEDFNLLNRTLLVRGIFVIALAPLGGWFLSRQLAGPIADIIKTARRLQPEHLEERLPVRGTNDELDRVSQTINGMLDRVADYIDRNRAFIANAAHELRSPLAAIRSSAEVTLNRPRTPEEYTNVLTDMVEEVDRLSSMVNRLLLLAETDAGRMVPAQGQSARLDKVVREAVDMFQAVGESREITIRVSDLAVVEVPAEDSSLRHIVRNLIDNAIKFSPPRSMVTVALTTAGDPRCAILTVADEGPGIAPQDVPRIFERFFRGDRSRQRGDDRGTGLGLSICQAITASLGGSIKVHSELGRGTTFTVMLPLKREQSD